MIIVLEGIDGVGKSSVIEDMTNIVTNTIVIPSVITDESQHPEYELGLRIRELLACKELTDDEITELEDLFVDMNRIKMEVAKKLDTPYTLVLIDRYWHSNVIYTGAYKDLPNYRNYQSILAMEAPDVLACLTYGDRPTKETPDEFYEHKTNTTIPDGYKAITSIIEEVPNREQHFIEIDTSIYKSSKDVATALSGLFLSLASQKLVNT